VTGNSTKVAAVSLSGNRAGAKADRQEPSAND